MLRNKYIRILFLILFAACLAAGAAWYDFCTPEESGYDSSGVSVSERRIDCTESVEQYSYQSLTGMQNSHVLCLKECEYRFWEELSIPGMPSTRDTDVLNNVIYSDSQAPQGLCFTEDFILLSSYSVNQSCLGELMVFDRQTGEYLTTLGMEEKTHLGGIAYDGQNVWICDSYNNAVNRISYDFVKLMAQDNKGQVIDASDMVDVYPVENSPSCITCYAGRLWVATHNVLFNSEVKAYYLDEEKDSLKALSSYTIPPKVQGIAFGDDGTVYLSTSYGRRSSSWLKVYSSLVEMSASPSNPVQDIEMPPCSEELELAEGNLFIIFESAGKKYYEGTDGNGISLSPIDEILILPTDDEGKIRKK